jgi:hypothetical protein
VSVILDFGIKQNNSAIPKSDLFAVKVKKVIVDHKVAVVAGVLIGWGVLLASIVPYRYYECKYTFINIFNGQMMGFGSCYKTGGLSLFQYLYYIWNPNSVCLAHSKLSSTPFLLK